MKRFETLLTVELDYKLLVYRKLNVFALGQRSYAALVVVAIDLQPVGRRLVAREFLCLLQNWQLAASFANGDLLAYSYLVGGDVDLAAVHLYVTVAHQLARLAPGARESEAIDNVVQPTLELLQELFAGDAFGSSGILKVVAELAFLGEVNTLSLLFFTQLKAVAYNLSLSIFPMLSGSEVALLDWTFIAETFCPFEEQLHALAAA